MKRNYVLVLIVLAGFIAFKACKKTEEITITASEPFKAIDMPSKLANGDAFPTDSTQINAWLSNPNVDADGVQNDPNIISHSWGLWQALTELTDQKYEGRLLRRYETWYTPQDVIKAMQLNQTLESLERNDGNLQFRKKFKFGHDTELNTSAGDISGKVKYSPKMAQTALDKKFFDHKVLKAKMKPGEINTVTFSTGDIMLKPIYRVLTDANKVGDGKYYFNIWAGKQDGGKQIQNFSKVIIVNTDTNSPMIATENDTLVYNIKNFIYHDMSEAEAYTYNTTPSHEGNEFNGVAKKGDAVILLGMHVSSRETRRWTWQSFFWSETPDNPVYPSSQAVADGRKGLNPALGAPENNYAASIAYSFASPALPYETKDAKPIDISKAKVASVYGLNPYIEGTFQKNVFPKEDSLFSIDPSYKVQYNPNNNDGLTSNCMGCHSQSYINEVNTAPGYQNISAQFMTDQYINRNAPWFKGSVQLDFAWSLFPGFEQPAPPMPKKKK